jgi:D-psicose/D-tagatose/L-ribulose 3-epimerase
VIENSNPAQAAPGTAKAQGLAVSNIAWPPGDEAHAEAMRILLDGGATGVEVAPSLLFTDPVHVTRDEVRFTRDRFEKHGLPVVAMQALLFNKPDLKVFGTPAEQSALREHLRAMASLAAGLGARVLVFGSPKNRLRGSLSPAQASEKAVPLFRELGQIAADLGVVFGIEANPPGYGCDWLTTLDEAHQFVHEVNSPGIALHGDAGGMIMTGQTPPAFTASLVHHHASEPELAPLAIREEHKQIATWLARSGHTAWISIEMRKPADNWQAALANALAAAKTCYGNCLGIAPR